MLQLAIVFATVRGCNWEVFGWLTGFQAASTQGVQPAHPLLREMTTCVTINSIVPGSSS
jgi:hypothetical protein